MSQRISFEDRAHKQSKGTLVIRTTVIFNCFDKMSCRQRHLLSSHNTAFHVCVRGYQLFYIITWQLVCGDNKGNLAFSHLPTCMALSFLRKVFCMGLRYLLAMSIITCVSLLALCTITCVSLLVKWGITWHLVPGDNRDTEMAVPSGCFQWESIANCV